MTKCLEEKNKMQTITKDGKRYKLVPIDEPIKAPYRLTKTIDIEIYPEDMPETMTYVKMVKAVEEIGDGWRIPTREELLAMYEQRVNIGGFCTKAASGSVYPQWCWSCTEHREDPDLVWGADFSDGYGGWNRKDYFRLSCRLVRLVPASSAS